VSNQNEQVQWEQAEPGVQRRIFEPGEKVMMMEVRFEQGAEGYLHQHSHEQISYCLTGSFEYTIDGVTHILKAGETIVVPGDAVHGVKALEPSSLLDAFTPLREDLLK